MIKPAICMECALRIHHHEGVCGVPATVTIPTASGGIEKRSPCTCEAAPTLGVRNPDTQMEMAIR